MYAQLIRRKRLVFDELEEDELPSPKAETSIIGQTPPVFTRILEFKGSPMSPPPKKARGPQPSPGESST
ncbi:hypothetical protein GCK32_019338 [Trichostrongylus colubriformis]|uniref:Uncharacterized protein n=1 Tax=Trichostrongylus colubriformis TaxID=6319 RepID=A0AAN8J1N4_TRICO